MLAEWAQGLTQTWSPSFYVKSTVQTVTSQFISKLTDGSGWCERGGRKRGRAQDFHYRDGIPGLFGADFVIDQSPELHDRKWLAVSLLKLLFRINVLEQPRLKSQARGEREIVQDPLSRLLGGT